ncbi:hypothetical protein V490_00091, partial [Pseudogymnoascus sp. VKM F-3557]
MLDTRHSHLGIACDIGNPIPPWKIVIDQYGHFEGVIKELPVKPTPFPGSQHDKDAAYLAAKDQGQSGSTVKPDRADVASWLQYGAISIRADTCLVEIARRDCNSEPDHRQQIDTKTPRDVHGDSTIPSRADEEPCESHYLKAKAAYSGMLDNIGCICKVLLSLNLDSCCVALPARPLRLKRSTVSTSEGLLAEMSRVSSARSLCKPQEGADCSK